MRCATHVDRAWNRQSIRYVSVPYGPHTAQLCRSTLLFTLPLTSPLTPGTTGAGDGGQLSCWGNKGWCPEGPLELTVQFPVLSWLTAAGVIIAITTYVIIEHLLWAMHYEKCLKHTNSFYAHSCLLGGSDPHLYMRKLRHRGVKSLNYGHDRSWKNPAANPGLHVF